MAAVDPARKQGRCWHTRPQCRTWGEEEAERAPSATGQKVRPRCLRGARFNGLAPQRPSRHGGPASRLRPRARATPELPGRDLILPPTHALNVEAYMCLREEKISRIIAVTIFVRGRFTLCQIADNRCLWAQK